MKNLKWQIIAIIIIIILTWCNIYWKWGYDIDYTGLTKYEEPYPDIAIDLTYLRPVVGDVWYGVKANQEFDKVKK